MSETIEQIREIDLATISKEPIDQVVAVFNAAITGFEGDSVEPVFCFRLGEETHSVSSTFFRDIRVLLIFLCWLPEDQRPQPTLNVVSDLLEAMGKVRNAAIYQREEATA
jgi:hypothetical protein